MNVNLLQLSITHVHELVRCVCGDDDDLACVRFERSGVYREGSDTFLYDENLLVGMLMQPYRAPGGISTQIKETSIS